eukprot:8134166-Lingulodinium_polyedra.AAC.1
MGVAADAPGPTAWPASPPWGQAHAQVHRQRPGPPKGWSPRGNRTSRQGFWPSHCGACQHGPSRPGGSSRGKPAGEDRPTPRTPAAPSQCSFRK